MTQRAIRRILIVFSLALASAIAAVAQSSTRLETFTFPTSSASVSDNWQAALRVASSKGKIIVVTVDQPNRRQSCQLQSFTPDQLVCSRAKGRRRTYLAQQVAALILPGDGGIKLWMMLLGNADLGAAIWGTVVLAATCPVCAALTGLDAASALVGAWVAPFGDDQPDRLLYLAPGQRLSRKFGHVKS
jgi:hypothetical protein